MTRLLQKNLGFEVRRGEKSFKLCPRLSPPPEPSDRSRERDNAEATTCNHLEGEEKHGAQSCSSPHPAICLTNLTSSRGPMDGYPAFPRACFYFINLMFS